MLIREIQFGVPFETLFAAVQERAHSFFLESSLVAGGLGRFSFLGFEPRAVLRHAAGKTTLRHADRREENFAEDAAPLEILRATVRRFAASASVTPAESRIAGTASCATAGHAAEGDVPEIPFLGGAVGFFSYEFGTGFERVRRTGIDDLAVPGFEFGFYDRVVACDVASGRTFLVLTPDHGSLGEHEIAATEFDRELRAALRTRGATAEKKSTERGPAPRSNFSRADYLAAIGRIKDYIAAGDVYQVNLSQRFATPLPCSPYELYRRLRTRSAAPFASFLNFGGVQVASASPERFLRVRGDHVTTRPIKGTRPRDADTTRDAALRAELLRSEKDRAELLMIVDLERNDLGRVCVPGSVKVESLHEIEAHPTVWHLVAEVSGQLAPGKDFFDLLPATFPGGSITGAPKIRAMQIIDELEPHRRHLYTGAIGYLGFNGDAEFNIAIRTVQCVDGQAYYHVGGGIVWDSDPAAEFDETLAKGRAIYEALTAPNAAAATVSSKSALPTREDQEDESGPRALSLPGANPPPPKAK